MNPAKAARKADTYRKTRGVPDEAREDYGHIRNVKPLRGCRAKWDGPEFPVTITKISTEEEHNHDAAA